MHYLRSVLEGGCSSQNTAVGYPCQILGRLVNSESELSDLLRNGFFLLTYRSDFDPLPGSNVTSDKGWGCLARSSQMLLAQALSRYSASDFKLEYFRDIDSVEKAPFSLHSMVQATLKSSDTFSPKYWSPSKGCEAIRCCVNEALDRRILSRPMSVVISSNGSISAKEVESQLEEKGAVLILTPLRCGASRLMTQMMFFALEHILHSSSCIGVVGGVPNRSYYVIGSWGQRLLYLDPHCMTQKALVSCDANDAGVVMATPSLVRSVRWDSVDTSFFFGFFLDSASQWQELRGRVEDVRKRSMEQLFFINDGEMPSATPSMLVEWPSDDDASER
ncbi:AUT2/APG4/ATG4 cysteine peptidase [Trypanosoma theileri]|uniref:Cysteine protease n=1 Tax=Trypanosoma theileri TaxID=67003 RepID=A0A1X0P2H1_9TRYP|nr:AUT2/APG4/ATG4 cysteine peptidase [Trypanosoma theileri]ORC91061.1 AUT2/APG4/ATG4 cysteine peptidase [Trypanosoma theileri]